MNEETQPNLILASGSPRRKDLLNDAGYCFEIIPPGIEEIDDPSMDIRELTAINARIKATAVSEKNPNRVVMAADTLVLLDDCPLGKPSDLDEAARTLRRLNGRTHHVFTAVCLVREDSDQVIEFAISTEVKFKSLSDDEMVQYHRLIDPLDKAGAYAAQEHGELIIERIQGSSTNVIGLPMEQLSEHLKVHFDIEPAM